MPYTLLALRINTHETATQPWLLYAKIPGWAMPDNHDTTYGNLQVTVALVTCTVMLWSDSFEVTAESLLGLEAVAIVVQWLLSPARAGRAASARARRIALRRFVIREPGLRERRPIVRVDELPAGRQAQVDGAEPQADRPAPNPV